MKYLVRLTDRALRDMEAIYEFIEAGSSESAFVWFNALAEAVYSLERFPERGAVTPGSSTICFFAKNQARTESFTRWISAKTP
jgi:plasmid stabilization system protein ParE